jgi:uncharacterized protein YjbI with pentapeptide repeats
VRSVPKNGEGLWKYLRDHDSDLSGADLRDASLTGFPFREANLEGAILRGARLEAADFGGANLSRACLERAELSSASLVSVKAVGTDFTNAEAISTDFAMSDLREAKFINTELERANFTDCDLRGADFTEAALTNTVFSHANVQGTALCGVMVDTIFVDVDLARAEMLEKASVEGNVHIDWETQRRIRSDLEAGVASPAILSFLRTGGFPPPRRWKKPLKERPMSQDGPFDPHPSFRVDVRLGERLAQTVSKAIAKATNEPAMQEFLEEHPEALAACLGPQHRGWVIPQKRLGSEYVTDFLVAGRSSLGFQWVAVELESPVALMFTKQGDMSKVLNHAIRQIQDWRNWLRSNLDYAQRPVAKNGLGLREISPELPGLVLLGQRSSLDEKTNQRRKSMARQLRIDIRSYDFLVQACSDWHPGRVSELLRSVPADR